MTSTASTTLQVTVVTKGYWEKSRYISRGSTGHWSKWGGSRMDLVQELTNIWHCQSCRSPQPRDLTPYKYEYPQGEYLRVCGPCIADDCMVLKVRLGL